MAEEGVRRILGDLTNINTNMEAPSGDDKLAPYPPKVDQVFKLEDQDDGYMKNPIMTPSSDWGMYDPNWGFPELNNDIIIKVNFQNQNKLLSGYPLNIKSFQQSIRVLFKIEIMFNLFFIDSSGDRIDIITNKDLKSLVKTLGGQNSRIIKIYVWPKDLALPPSKPGIDGVDQVWEAVRSETQLVRFSQRTRSISKSIGVDDKIIRNECTYLLKYSYGNRLYYQCWKTKEHCKGIWKISKNGGEGKLHRDHSLKNWGIMPQAVENKSDDNGNIKQEAFPADEEKDKDGISNIQNISSVLSRLKKEMREMLIITPIGHWLE